MHRRQDMAVDRDNGRDLANNILGAIYLELPGRSHLPWLGNVNKVIDDVVNFAGASIPAFEERNIDNRRLATALFTDIVQSTS